MQKIMQWKYFLIFAIAFVVLTFYVMGNKDKGYNKYKCETKKMSIHGVINYSEGRSSYHYVGVNNLEKTFSLNPAQVLRRKGFDEYHYYEVGDSLIKDANSKIVTVKRGDSIIVFTLDCDD